MKSIKEKANEYTDEHGFRVPYDGSNNFYDETDVKASQEGFKEGANYVVEEIEKLVKTTIGDGETYHYNLYIGLINLLEQLKK